jgi:hypothetical protein
MVSLRSPEGLATTINREKKRMNTSKEYDQLLAEKMAEIPVPDMADTIWTKIHEQVFDSPKPKNGFPRNLSLFVGAGVIFLVVVIVLVVRSSNKKAESTLPAPISTSRVSQIPDSMEKKMYSPLMPDTTAKGGFQHIRKVPFFTGHDSLYIKHPVTIQGRRFYDSAVKISFPPAVLPQILDTKDTVNRRSIGVQNIHDSDYRLLIRKDSLP